MCNMIAVSRWLRVAAQTCYCAEDQAPRWKCGAGTKVQTFLDFLDFRLFAQLLFHVT